MEPAAKAAWTIQQRRCGATACSAVLRVLNYNHTGAFGTCSHRTSEPALETPLHASAPKSTLSGVGCG